AWTEQSEHCGPGQLYVQREDRRAAPDAQPDERQWVTTWIYRPHRCGQQQQLQDLRRPELLLFPRPWDVLMRAMATSSSLRWGLLVACILLVGLRALYEHTERRAAPRPPAPVPTVNLTPVISRFGPV